VKDCEARRLSTTSLDKYNLLTDELKEKFGKRPIRSLGLPELRQYRESWDMAPISAAKEIRAAADVLQVLHGIGWVRDNPAKLIKAPQTRPKPTLPFTDPEIEKIMWATEVYPNKGIYREQVAEEVRVFINLLRLLGASYSRCGDTFTGQV